MDNGKYYQIGSICKSHITDHYFFGSAVGMMSIFGRRLKEARLKAGLSQEQLGIEAELDPASASARMNRYELGKRVPNFELVEKIAVLLDLPVPYFYTSDEDMAQLLLKLHRLSKTKRQKVMQFVIEISDKK